MLQFPSSLQGDMQPMCPPPVLKPSKPSIESETTCAAPTSAQIQRSSTTLHQLPQARPDAQQIQSEPLAERTISGPNMGMLGSMQEKIQEEVHYRSSPLRHTPAIQTPWQHTRGPPPSAAGIAAMTDTYRQADSYKTSSTPALASPNLPFPDTLEHEIPPRRELPFDKRPTSSRQSGSDRSGSRPGTAAVPLTTGAKRDLIDLCSGGSASTIISKTAESSRPKSASPLKRTALTAFGDTLRPYTAIAPRPSAAASQSSNAPLSTRLSEAESAAPKETPIHRPPRMHELLYGKRPLTEKSGNLPSCVRNPADVLHVPDEQSPSVSLPNAKLTVGHASVLAAAAKATPATGTTRQDPSLRAYDAIPPSITTTATATAMANSTGTKTAPATQSDLESYAAQSLEDRHAALDEFMVQSLENPAFTTLCEDVESCWRRIALGL
nr:hypothetical protein CFP56_13290 [Quercus suber]